MSVKQYNIPSWFICPGLLVRWFEVGISGRCPRYIVQSFSQQLHRLWVVRRIQVQRFSIFDPILPVWCSTSAAFPPPVQKHAHEPRERSCRLSPRERLPCSCSWGRLHGHHSSPSMLKSKQANKHLPPWSLGGRRTGGTACGCWEAISFNRITLTAHGWLRLFKTHLRMRNFLSGVF